MKQRKIYCELLEQNDFYIVLKLLYQMRKDNVQKKKYIKI